MKISRLLRTISTVCLLVLPVLCRDVFCAGVVTKASQASLLQAMAGGGLVTFQVNGTIFLTNTITVATNTALDATGHNVTISGSNAVSIFNVPQGISFSLTNLILADGVVQITNLLQSSPTPESYGGAICSAGTVEAFQCVFRNNSVLGAQGTYGAGEGLGGAIFNMGSLWLNDAVFVNNTAQGGPGLVFSVLTTYRGGAGLGGALFNGGEAAIGNCQFVANSAVGGAFPVPDPEPFPDEAPGAGASGGAIFNTNTLSVVDSTFDGNSCDAGSGGPGGPVGGPGEGFYGGDGGLATGAGICSAAGSVLVASTTFFANSAQGGSGGPGGAGFFEGNGGFEGIGGPGGHGGMGGQAMGGGVCSLGGIFNVLNCTFCNNTAASGAGGMGGPGTASSGPGLAPGGNGGNGANGGSASGGAIAVINGNMSLTNVTFSGNYATVGSGGSGGPGGAGNNFLAGNGAGGSGGSPGSASGFTIAVTNGSVTLLNSILSCASGETNISGDIVDAGYNINSDDTSVLTNVWSLNGIDPGIGPLGNYGGPTATMPLLAGSPAIDAANPASFPPTDQRGRRRPYGRGPDIGAFESSPPYSITGNVSDLSTSSAALVAADTNTAAVNPQGDYVITNLAAGAYSVVPESQGYWFLPASFPVTVIADETGVDFTAHTGEMLASPSLTNGAVNLVIEGPAGQAFRVQTSGDLINWLSIATNTFNSSNSFRAALPANAPMQFYRVVVP